MIVVVVGVVNGFIKGRRTWKEEINVKEDLIGMVNIWECGYVC